MARVYSHNCRHCEKSTLLDKPGSNHRALSCHPPSTGFARQEEEE